MGIECLHAYVIYRAVKCSLGCVKSPSGADRNLETTILPGPVSVGADNYELTLDR